VEQHERLAQRVKVSTRKRNTYGRKWALKEHSSGKATLGGNAGREEVLDSDTA